MSVPRALFPSIGVLLAAAIASAQSPCPPGSGSYLVFNGINSVVDTGGWASPVDHTIEAWVRSPSSSGETIAGHIGLRCCGQGYRLLGSGSYHADLVGCGGCGPFVTDSNPDSLQWHHYAATMDTANSTLSLYRDGQLIQQTSSCVSCPPVACWDADDVFDWFAIGAFKGGACGAASWQGFFSGHIDEVRSWNVVRTPAEIAANFDQLLTGSEAGLIGYWPFEEGGGTVTVDWSSGMHNGTLIGGVAWGLDPVGATYCSPAVANSTGSPAGIAAAGCTSVSKNNLVLRSSPVPNGPGVFIFGSGQASLPFGDGVLCVGGAIVRLPGVFSSAQVMELQVDLSAPNVAAKVIPGSTWNFQAWFRDLPAGAAGFNLSDGLQLSFVQ